HDRHRSPGGYGGLRLLHPVLVQPPGWPHHHHGHLNAHYCAQIFGREHPEMMNSTAALARQFIDDEDGQDVVEYGLLIATIAIVVLVATAAFGSSIQSWFNRLAGRITTTAT